MRERDVGEAMADVAGAKPVRDLGLEVDAQLRGRARPRPRETVVGLPVPTFSACPSPPRPARAPLTSRVDDVGDMHEVAALLAVLEDDRGRPFSSREAKIAATPVYGLESAWRGP